MNIEITQSAGPIDFNGYEIYCNNQKVLNLVAGYQQPFYESDIYEMLSSKQYKQFEDGKFQFNVTKKSIFDVSKDPSYFRP